MNSTIGKYVSFAMLRKASMPLLIAAAAVSFVVLLLHGVRSNLPYIYDLDEIEFVTMATQMVHHHDPNPHWFGHPGTTLLYLMPITWAAMYVIGHGLGMYGGIQAFGDAYFRDVTPFYEAGRLIVATFALVSLALTFTISKRIFGTVVATLATALLACSPLFLSYSALVRTDVVMTAFVLASTLAALSVLETSSLRASLAAGALAGLAFDTKFPAAIVFATIFLAHWWSAEPSRARRASACVGAFLGTSFLASPFLYLDFHTVIKDILFERRPAELGGVGEGFVRNLGWYVHDPLGYGLGAVVLLAALLGIAFACRGPQKARLLVPYPLLTLIFISLLSLRWDRWAVTLLPWGAIFAAYGISSLVKAVPQRTRLRGVVATILLLLAFTPLVASEAKVVATWDAVDPRTAAAHWMESNVPRGSRIFLEPLSAEMNRDRFDYFAISPSGKVYPVDQRTNLHPTFIPLHGNLALLSPSDGLVREGVQFAVVDRSVLEAYDAAPIYSQMARRERRVIAGMQFVHAWPEGSTIGEYRIALYRVGPPQAHR